MGAITCCNKGNYTFDEANDNIIWDYPDIIVDHNKDAMKIQKELLSSEHLKKTAKDDKKCEVLFNKPYYKGQCPDLSGCEKYTDLIFEADQNSKLYIPEGHEQANILMDSEKEDILSFEWKRCSDIVSDGNDLIQDDHKLYGTIQEKDIRQGVIGNCYFLCSISALAEYKDRFNDIFITKERSKNGAYQLRLMIDGLPKIVTIDDYFLWNNQGNNFAGANSGYGEIWVQVIEKAWAKICKSYAMTVAGTPADALCALTEAPVMSYIHRKYNSIGKKLLLWHALSKAEKKKYIICTNTGGKSEEDYKKLGLVFGHAYSLLDCYQDENGSLQLVKLRNPWGEFEWKGDFSDDSPEWDKYPDLKEKLNHDKKDDGIFFMKYEDYLDNFPYTFISHYKENSKYNYLRVLQADQDSITKYKINIPITTEITISMHQRQERLFTKIPGYTTQMARIILAKYTPYKTKNYEFIGSNSNNQEKLHITTTLQPGEYHIFANNAWPYSHKNKYAVSTYADIDVPIEPLEIERIPDDFLDQILSSYCKKKCKLTDFSNSVDYENSIDDNDTGFYMFHIYNKSQTDYICYTWNYTINKNVKFCSMHCVKDLQSKEINHGYKEETIKAYVEPGDSDILIFKLMDSQSKSKLITKSYTVDYIPANKIKHEDIYNPNNNYMKLIKELNNSLEKNELVKNVNYSELEIEDGYLVIIENISKKKAYMVSVNYEDMINCSPAESFSRFAIAPGCIEYVRMKIIDKDNKDETSYSLNFSLKEL